MSVIDTTLMMVTYNRLELTKETLEGLFNSDPGRNFNLIIVDNGSSDGTREYFDYLWNGVYPSKDGVVKVIPGGPPEIIKLHENKGIAVGRNVALKRAVDLGTKWFCTIDNDVKMPKNWLQECVEILEANKSWGAIGVNFELAPYPIISRGGYTFQDKPAGNLGTACMVFRKQVQQMLGYFTTEYGLYGEEDADFGMRARVAGFKLGYLKEMGTHLGEGEQDAGEYRDFKTKQHADNLALFQRNCALYAQRKKPLFVPYKDR